MDDANKLARYFAALIRVEYTPDELAEVNRRNATPAYAGSCATHDFRDANAYMFGAFAALWFETPDAGNPDHSTLINRAWDIAREKEFTL